MTAAPAGRLADLPLASLDDALSTQGLWFDLGAVTVRVQATSRHLAPQLQATYAEFPLVTAAPWADVHCRLDPARGLRRWLRAQVVFVNDGRAVFQPFPADAPLPLFEWGCNWLIGQQTNDRLLLHAGVVERDGLALLLPATPGSGKSTLTAALAQRGWRLLSDEFAAVDLDSGLVVPLLKPVALKNQSIDVIHRFAPTARLGPRFPKTRKGTVAHLAASADAVARRHERARPAVVVMPRWQAGSPTQWDAAQPHETFAALAFNAFNYQLLGEPAFDTVVALSRRCAAWRLTYSDLDEVVVSLDRLWETAVRSGGPAS